jgi:hypothetical protein
MTGYKKRKHTIAASRATVRPVNREEFIRVMQELESAYQDNRHADTIVEQLKQCPDAFKAGEMVSKMFDSIKYGKDEHQGEERYLPPAGVVMPPLV